MSGREKLIVARIDERLQAICKAVPPIKAPAAHWLYSDSGPSYCWRCACIARGKEFELGAPINPSTFRYDRDDYEDAFFDGIEGGFDTTSDSSAACTICGRTLSYILTDEGVALEIDYYREAPLALVREEDSYALDRLCLNIWEGSPRDMILGAAIAVNQAWRIIQNA